MSVVVLYRGQRKTFKCGPAPMKSTLDEAMQHFKINSTLEGSLVHKNKKVDLSTPFRLSSIPNNALLELVCSSGKARSSGSGSDAETRLALSCDSGFGNLSGKFRSDMTLLEILTFFVEQSPPLLPAPLLDANICFSPPLEVIYLRQRIVGLDALGTCSLSSLGLAGSSARMQIRIPTAVASGVVQDSCSAATSTSSPTSSEANIPTNVIEVQQGRPNSEEKELLNSNKIEGYYVESKGSQPLTSASLLPPPTQQQEEHDKGQQQQQLQEDSCDELPMDISSQDSSERIPAPQSRHTPSITPTVVHAAVSAVLDSNFDVVSRSAIFTSVKYLDNLIKYPDPDDDSADAAGLAKYRSINLGNKIIREQILACNKGIDLLLALGFEAVEAVSSASVVQDFAGRTSTENLPERLTFGFARVKQDWLLSPSTLKGYKLKPVCIDQDGSLGGVVLVSTLLDAREVLCTALSKLDHFTSSPSSSSTAVAGPVPMINLLQSISRRQSPSGSSSSSTPTVVEFDPYKPLIMQAGADKVAVKPLSTGDDRASSSSTSAKLKQLNKRRLELEGDRSSVQRLTQVSVKGRSRTSDMAAPKESSSEVDMRMEVTDGQIQAQALKKVILKAQDDEGPALTTRALKELEQAQKAVVHRQTLIKIIFPDQLCLQAYFHPRDTVHDIAQWLQSECFADNTDTDGKAVQYDFDLYTSPPRRSIFFPQQPEQEERTLQDLSLVPAAVIHLAWQGASAEAVGSRGGAGHETVDRPYLSPILSTKLNAEKDGLSFQSFPSGQKLVPSDQSDAVSAAGKSGSNRGKAMGNGGSDPASGGKKVGKPKWFKL